MEFLLDGFRAVTWQQGVMYLVGFALIYLAIQKDYEPALLTRAAAEHCENHDLTGRMVIGTSAIVDTELDGAVGMNSGIFNNSFFIWGKYRKTLFKTTLKLSFQFHHTQMERRARRTVFAELAGNDRQLEIGRILKWCIWLIAIMWDKEQAAAFGKTRRGTNKKRNDLEDLCNEKP